MEQGTGPVQTQGREGLGTDEMQVRLSEMRERIADLDERTRTFVRAHPVASVMGAVAAGYLVGRLFTRR